MTTTAGKDNRRRVCGTAALTLLVSCALSSLAHGQTNDIAFRSWHWEEMSVTPRAAGLAGAAVALTDDAAGLEANPASLATLERTILAGAFHSLLAGTTPSGDRLRARHAVSQLGAALRLTSRLTLGLQLGEPQARLADLTALTTASGARDAGFLEAVTTDVSAALALRVRRRLMLGARVTGTHLALEADYRSEPGDSPAWLRVGTGGGVTKTTFAFGTMLDLGRGLFAGATYAPGVTWNVTRTAISPRLGLTLDSGSSDAIARPARTAAGLAFRPAPRLLVALEADEARCAALGAGLPGGYASLAFPRRTRTVRVGLELSFPRRTLAVTGRAGLGLSHPSSATWSVEAPARNPRSPFSAFDLATGLWERAADTPDGRADDVLLAAGGLSLTTRAGWTLDLAVTRNSERVALVSGLSFRF